MFLLLQGDESKARAKKPGSKYNEEISSDSETERFISYTLIKGMCIDGWFMVSTVKHRSNSTVCLCLLLHSPVVGKKRQSNEEPEYEETPQEKKLRLAKLYLDQLKEEGKLVLELQRLVD